MKMIVALSLALILTGCQRVDTKATAQSTSVSASVEPADQVVKICKDGWIVMHNNVKSFAPGGSNERWVIASTANESDICKEP